MRIVLSLLLVLFAIANADAQAPQVDRIDVVEYGIYTSTITGYTVEPGTASGVARQITNIQHAVTTRAIPAQLNIEFGYRFALVGSPAGASVPLHFVTVFPPPGLLNPETQQVKAQDEFDRVAVIGNADTFRTYTLNHDWELVPGVWTFQIWYQGRKFAEQSFTLVKQ